MAQDDIVGFKCPMDGTGCQPLTKEEAQALWQAAHDCQKKRELDMPTERDAVNALFQAFLRLKELGWKEAMYCPKDGTPFDVIEPGSTGIHRCHYEGEWPDGSWWVSDNDDSYPSNPILFKPKPKT